ncbi:MAG: DUF72 domain-containing protein [Campylobacterales bacterium]
MIRIGTSGWHFEHWAGEFYPEGLKKEERLGYYKKHFDTVEINNTFYQLPSQKSVEEWREEVGSEFLFCPKASRYTTHMKKLKDPKKSSEKFFKAIEPLGENLGPVLFQLPPKWDVNPKRLKEFLEVLPEEYRYVFEFRDERWLVDEVYEILNKHNAAFCIYDLERFTSPLSVTANFSYIRLHGPSNKAYSGEYGDEGINEWKKRVDELSQQVDGLFVFFDNDQKSFAPKDAMLLQESIKE